MTETATTRHIPKVDFGGLPMSLDRATGWAALRDLGPVVEGENCFYVTRWEEVLALTEGFIPEIVWPAATFGLKLLPLRFLGSVRR